MDEELLNRLEDMGAEVDDTLQRLMDDKEMYLYYLRQLPDNQNIVELRKAVDAGDSKKAENEIHTLKGVALNLGILPLVDVCMDMLLDFRGGKTAEAMAQIGIVEQCFQKWADAIKA